MIIDGVSKQGINGIHLASVPCHFNGVADGPFHAAGGGVAFFCNGGIQLLGDMPAGGRGVLFSVIDLVCRYDIKMFIGLKDSIYCY